MPRALRPLRGPLLAALLLAPLLAGCAAPSERDQVLLLALDGRWDFPSARAAALLERAGLPEPLGEARFGTGLLHFEGGVAAADFAAFDAAALQALGATYAPPEPGTALLLRGAPEAPTLAPGAQVELRSWRFPSPLVATAFEMDRTRPCDERPDAKLCFATFSETQETELRLRVPEGARDLAFLPDLAELGGAVPAWWNGTFRTPSGQTRPFLAAVDAQGAPTPGAWEGELEPGPWSIRYTLDTPRGRAPAGLAGIVRLREPGYLWYDDRLQEIPTSEAQAAAVLANATPGAIQLRIAGEVDAPAPLRGHLLLLAPDDARRLRGADEGAVAGLVLRAPADAPARFRETHGSFEDGLAAALRLRPFPDPSPLPPQAGALLFRAPPDVDPTALPPVEGGGRPTLALAMQPAYGEPVALEGKPLARTPRVLAHAGPAGHPAPFDVPPGGRWPTPESALENLTRSRTLALGSQDISDAPVSVARLTFGDEITGRTLVLAGSVRGGPATTLWVATPLVAGAGEPAGARVLLPLAPGADPAVVLERARTAWAPHGLAPEPSSKA